VLGAWHLKRKDDEPQGYFTLLFRRFGNEWKVVADHSS
jgi:ketosteroid isomerase-like protein